jgi:hypothetical protein
MDLVLEVESLRSRADVVAFVRHLQRDLEEHHDEWENDDLGRYLEALAAWVEDMDGFYENVGEPLPDRPDWRMLGRILMAAKSYE